MNRKKLATIALIPALGAVAFAHYAFAADNATTTASTTKHPQEMHKRGDNTQFASNLATALGLSATDVKARLDSGEKPNAIIASTGKSKETVQEALQAARTASMKARLATEVAAGKITQAKADEMIARIESNTGVPGGEHGPRDNKENTQFATDLATALGLSATDVKAKLDAGTKPDEIIAATGKTPADVMASMKTLMEANMKAKLAADVTSGKITQAQADEMITNMANHVGRPHRDHGPRPTDSTTTSTQ